MNEKLFKIKKYLYKNKLTFYQNFDYQLGITLVLPNLLTVL